MSTPKDISNKLIRDFFHCQVGSFSEKSLAELLEGNEHISGADLVEQVQCFYLSCKEEGIL